MISKLLLLFLLHLFKYADTQTNCANAPTAVLQIWCNQLVSWDNGARTAVATLTSAVSAPGSSAPVSALGGSVSNPGDVYSCMTMQCLCQNFGGTMNGNLCFLANGVRLGRSSRKEYRMMTTIQRNKFHRAMWTIKNNGVFDQLATLHANPQIAAGAHGGPAFLPWHREYVKRMEFALRRVDPQVIVPYWDSTLESNLPTPADSCLFTNELMGQTQGGRVITGAFRNWIQLDGTVLQRNVGGFGTPFTEQDVQAALNAPNINNILAFTAPRSGCPFQADFTALEYTHGNPHVWVGGAMLNQVTASADPLFWMHHSFVDDIWEQWRQRRQTASQRETQYPPDNVNCSPASHFGNSIMRPFTPKTNRDGLSNDYTPGLYVYEPRPSCSLGANCGSQFLFCDRSHGTPRCAAKVRVSGNCRGFTRGEDVCYLSTCVNGVCVARQPQMTTQPPIETTRPQTSTGDTCYNENQCCGPWAAQGECTRNPGYMRVWCEQSCGVCRPTTYNPATECSNRHPNCAQWAGQGECRNNPDWMSENCRQACNLCGRTRAQTCGGGGGTVTTTRAPATTTRASSCNSPGCFNENVCCSTWADANYCTRSPSFMSCNCRVSCGYCRPNYAHGSCTNYNTNCAYWASIGECTRNAWMRENCRQSCRTCYSTTQLRGMCSTKRQGFRPTGRRQGADKQKPFKGAGSPSPKPHNATDFSRRSHHFF